MGYRKIVSHPRTISLSRDQKTLVPMMETRAGVADENHLDILVET